MNAEVNSSDHPWDKTGYREKGNISILLVEMYIGSAIMYNNMEVP